MSTGENMSPVPKMGILIFPDSTICLTKNHFAGTFDFSDCVRGCIEIK